MAQMNSDWPVKVTLTVVCNTVEKPMSFSVTNQMAPSESTAEAMKPL